MRTHFPRPLDTTGLLQAEEVSDGINIIIDDRWVAIFPMESRAQVDHLITAVNRAVRQKYVKRG